VRAVQLDPDYADAHHNLGNALLLTGRWPEAIRQYQEVLRLQPDDAAAKSGVEMAERAWQSRK
jgi:protein O-GlcNAc transferase